MARCDSVSADAALQAVDDPVQLKLLQVRCIGQGSGGIRPCRFVLLVQRTELPASPGTDEVPAAGRHFSVQDHVVNAQIEEVQGLDLPRGVCRGAYQRAVACPSQDVTGTQEFLEVVVTPEAGEKQVFILAGELSQNEGGQCEETDLGGGQGYDPGSGSDLLRSLIRVNRLPP